MLFSMVALSIPTTSRATWLPSHEHNFVLHCKKPLYAQAANRLAVGDEASPAVGANQASTVKISVATKPPDLVPTDHVEAAFSRCPPAKGNAPMNLSLTATATDRDTGQGFWQSGHSPTLLAAFLYFDVSFMVWVMLGPLAPIISTELGLDPAEKGLMVAVPTLAGAILRLVNGLLGDRIGQKLTGTANQLIVMAGLLVGWWYGVDSFAGTLA